MPRWMDSVPLPSGDGSPATNVAQVCHQLGFGQVAAPVHALDVEVFLVCAADEIGHVGDGAVGNHVYGLDRLDGAQVAGLAAKVLNDLAFRGEAEARQPGAACLP